MKVNIYLKIEKKISFFLLRAKRKYLPKDVTWVYQVSTLVLRNYYPHKKNFKLLY